MGRRAPAWLVGISYLPFGLYNGFVAIAMPFLLTGLGLPLDRVLGLQFVILLPSFLSFLLTPLVDSMISRRAWALFCAASAGAALLVGVSLLHEAGRGATASFASVMLLGYLAVQMFSSALGGMVPNLVGESDTGSASAWINIAYLGGTGLGGWLGSVLIPSLGARLAAPLLGILVFAPSLLLLAVGRELRVPRAFTETAQRLLPDIVAVSRTRSAIVGMLIFLTPSATFAAQNSFSGLGRDFHVSDSIVTFLTGWGSAIICSLGAPLGGWLANRLDRRMMFVGAGVLAAFASLGMAFGSRSSAVFIIGTAVYYLFAGINYAAASVVAFDIMGVNNPLSATQYAVLMACCNVAIETVIKGDQWGYSRGSARGLLITDAAFSLVCGSVMLATIYLWGGNGREPNRLNIDAAAELV